MDDHEYGSFKARYEAVYTSSKESFMKWSETPNIDPQEMIDSLTSITELSGNTFYVFDQAKRRGNYDLATFIAMYIPIDADFAGWSSTDIAKVVERIPEGTVVKSVQSLRIKLDSDTQISNITKMKVYKLCKYEILACCGDHIVEDRLHRLRTSLSAHSLRCLRSLKWRMEDIVDSHVTDVEVDTLCYLIRECPKLVEVSVISGEQKLSIGHCQAIFNALVDSGRKFDHFHVSTIHSEVVDMYIDFVLRDICIVSYLNHEATSEEYVVSMPDHVLEALKSMKTTTGAHIHSAPPWDSLEWNGSVAE